MILKFISSTSDLKLKISYFNTLASIAKSSASKQSEYVNKILGILIQYLSIDFLHSFSSTDEYDLKNELVEASLTIVEIYILKLTNFMKPQIKEVVMLLLKLVDYDPNYDYNNCESAYNEDYDYDYDYAAYSNDDSSWKVRRSSVKTIQSIVKSRMDIDQILTTEVIAKLVSCIKEREENTKLEIINCLSSYLRSFIVENEIGLSKRVSFVSSIDDVLKNLLENLNTELANSKSKVTSSILHCFGSLASVEPFLVIQSLPSQEKILFKFFTENNDFALKTLHFISKALKNMSCGSNISSEIPSIIEWIKRGIRHEYYKVVIEAIELSSLFIKVLSFISEYSTEVANEMYELLIPKLKLNDTDQELKLSVISASGSLLLCLGGHLSKEKVNSILTIFYEKQNNDNLIISVFGWLIKILKENKSINLEVEMEKYVELLLKLIVKYSLKFQFQALELLKNISTSFPNSLRNYITNIESVLLQTTKEESLIEIIYDILMNLYSYFNIDSNSICKALVHTIKLLEMTDHHLSKNVFAFLSSMTNKIAKKDLNSILNAELTIETMNYNKAKSIGILSKATQSEKKGIDLCMKIITDTAAENHTLCKNAFICLGEIVLTSSHTYEKAYSFVEKQLRIIADDLKHDASTCLGRVAVGNLSLFVSKLENISTDLLGFYLIACKEALIEMELNDIIAESTLVTTLMGHLISHTNSEDEKIRQITGECLGSAALLSESQLSVYFSYFSSTDEDVLAACLVGLKSIFTSKKFSSNDLQSAIQALLLGMASNSLKLKQTASSSLAAFVFNYFDFIKLNSNLYHNLWEIFAKLSYIDNTLIDLVDLGGGIKIKNDKGLIIRKAVYLSLKILVEHIPEKLNIFSTIELLLKGLSDVEDIQSLCTSCLIKISLFAPEAFISIIEPLVDILGTKLKSYSVPLIEGSKIDTSKVNYYSEEIYRLLSELNKISEIEENAKFTDLLLEIEKNIELANNPELATSK